RAQPCSYDDAAATRVKGRFQVVGLISNKGRVAFLCPIVQKRFRQHSARRLSMRTFPKCRTAENPADDRALLPEAALKRLMHLVELRPGHRAARDFRLVGTDRNNEARLVEPPDTFGRALD